MSLWDEMLKLQSALSNRAAEVKAKKQAWLQEQQNKVHRHAANSESTLRAPLKMQLCCLRIAV
ncbi:MAG: hypothetical protein K2P67_06635 [Gallionellaceae bacterium]|nr:hypothetical protein [Gallionellaceae bacterium]